MPGNNVDILIDFVRMQTYRFERKMGIIDVGKTIEPAPKVQSKKDEIAEFFRTDQPFGCAKSQVLRLTSIVLGETIPELKNAKELLLFSVVKLAQNPNAHNYDRNPILVIASRRGITSEMREGNSLPNPEECPDSVYVHVTDKEIVKICTDYYNTFMV